MFSLGSNILVYFLKVDKDFPFPLAVFNFPVLNGTFNLAFTEPTFTVTYIGCIVLGWDPWKGYKVRIATGILLMIRFNYESSFTLQQ